MDSNDDFNGKELNLNCFYTHTIFGQKYLKPAIVPPRNQNPNVVPAWSTKKVNFRDGRSGGGKGAPTQILVEKRCRRAAKARCIMYYLPTPIFRSCAIPDVYRMNKLYVKCLKSKKMSVNIFIAI